MINISICMRVRAHSRVGSPECSFVRQQQHCTRRHIDRATSRTGNGARFTAILNWPQKSSGTTNHKQREQQQRRWRRREKNATHCGTEALTRINVITPDACNACVLSSRVNTYQDCRERRRSITGALRLRCDCRRVMTILFDTIVL